MFLFSRTQHDYSEIDLLAEGQAIANQARNGENSFRIEFVVDKGVHRGSHRIYREHGRFARFHGALLDLLASRAAISLENTRLCADLQEREAKVQRLVDSNIIGIHIWDFEGSMTDPMMLFCASWITAGKISLQGLSGGLI
jgi:hypothetical protein